MSEPDALPALAPRRNPARSLTAVPVARAVHGWRVAVLGTFMMLSTSFLIGCVIPPSLAVVEDAGMNSPPAILSVTSDQQALPEPGPVLFDEGRTAGSLSVSLIDTDTIDTLYVRIFVDYNLPDRLDARVRCPPSPTTTPVRTVTCNLSTLCNDTDVGVQRNMSIVVFDRQPLEDGSDPPFQAMPAGGLSTSRFYFLKCQPRQP